ncbi:MAG: Flp pilus assembly complex ATPase component TadA [Planctomycetes bacterium]|nr:Flp pilus assembly complex ATPase component TadA [Planctomycetota bacterium]
MSLGDVLLAKGQITSDQLEAARGAQGSGDEPLEKVLVRMGFVEEEAVLEIMGEQLSLPVVDLSSLTIDPKLLKIVPAKLVHRYGFIPISQKNGTLTVATSNPHDLYAFDELRMLTHRRIEMALAPESEINRLIKQFYGVGGSTIEDMVAEEDVEIISDSIDESGDVIEMAQEATVVKLVNEILIEAIRDRATDVHIEPYETQLKIRYRIDGVLHNAPVPAEIQRFQLAIISRIKILSSLNIAEKRLPQDGGFKIKTQGREIDIRVSIIPTSFGEAVVMRILDKQATSLSLATLGMSEEAMGVFKGLIAKPHGILLVTGPTGSGKTTTLYSALNMIKSETIKILTIEDPIEYYLEGISQVQINHRIGLDFARGLRSFLRHDPDVILVGEIRDKETAEVAINASLTGHLVFSTLHTNDAVSATTRLLDMGVEPFLISSTVEAILAQRLLRVICKKCKQPMKVEPKQLPPDFKIDKGATLYHGTGCRHCRGSGYVGRQGIFELLILDDTLRDMIVQRASAAQLLKVALKDGLRLLRHDGWDKVRAGVTTVEEVLRVSKA